MLVGRPNVGKSTLFNRITGSRRAIVNPMAGTTRDSLARPAVWRGSAFELFDTGRAELKRGAERTITQLAEFLRQNPTRSIVVEGFTDATGTAATNQTLSERRAAAVGTALIARGISPARVTTRGYGETYPVASNDTATGRQLNLRVEILLPEEGRPVAIRR